MRRIRREGTAPELAVRRILSREGIRYRLNAKGLPGSPDIANRRLGFAIFVHGCFWHRHRGCTRATFPKTNAAFWSDKFRANVVRDKRNIQALREWA